MAQGPLGRRPDKGRPAIWASGGQRPPFDLRALGRGSLHLSREAVARLLALAARGTRRAALSVKGGRGRIPAGKLGRAERCVPSHLRVAAWIANLGATFAHASATADRDIARGNALVAEISPHLWVGEPVTVAEPAPASATESGEALPVVLAEPRAAPEDGDPLAAIRDEIEAGPVRRPEGTAPAVPPAPRGPLAEGAVQVIGWLAGWAATGLALPYGLGRALWLWAGGHDLKAIGRED